MHDGGMDYMGYNGTITADDGQLMITHSGFTAKTGGLAVDQPRRIPLQAISAVALKDASRMTNGWLTLGLGGEPLPNLNVGSAGSDANTVMFRHKSQVEFKTLFDWLETVVAHNKAHGIDPSAVEFDAPASTRLERLRERAERGVENAAEAQTAKMTDLLGEDRPDIVAAAARMGWRMGGKRELKKLVEHLHEGETVRFIAQGTYESNQGILVLTDVRLLFLFHGLMSQVKEDFPLRLISSVKTKAGLVTGEMQVFVSGNSSSISGIVKADLGPLAEEVRRGIAAQGAPTTPTSAPPTPTAAEDPYESLRKLAGLRDAGVLSEAEFEEKKRVLLDRL